MARRATVDTPDPQGRAHGRLGRVLGLSLKSVGDVNATVANWNVSFAKHARTPRSRPLERLTNICVETSA